MERKSLRYLQLGICFDFLDFTVGRFNLLPDFVGMLLFYASIQSHGRYTTQTEDKVKPLFLVLATDYFLHWVWQFENGLESLLFFLIYLYAMFVLMGEAAGRIRASQPEQARRIDAARVAVVLLQTFSFLAAPYGGELVSLLILVSDIGLAIALLTAVWKVRPVEA